MSNPVAKSAQSVQNALDHFGLNCKVVEFPSGTRTAIDAANAIGCQVSQIAKSLIFKTETNQPVLVIASGPNRVNEQIIAETVGQKIFKADADFVREITGFAIGGIPPLGHKTTIDFIFIDEDLLNFDKVWAAAGTPNSVFEIGSKELVKITGGKVLKVC